MRVHLFRSDDDPVNRGYWSLTRRGRTWTLDLYRHQQVSPRWWVNRTRRQVVVCTRTHVTGLAWFRR